MTIAAVKPSPKAVEDSAWTKSALGMKVANDAETIVLTQYRARVHSNDAFSKGKVEH